MKLVLFILLLSIFVTAVVKGFSLRNETTKNISKRLAITSTEDGTQHTELPNTTHFSIDVKKNDVNFNNKNNVLSQPNTLEKIITNSSEQFVQQSRENNTQQNSTSRFKSNLYWHQENKKCDDSEDCPDVKMVCRNRYCHCSRFHDWISEMNTCVANITKIRLWIRKTTPNETDSVSQPVPFQVIQTEPYTILVPTWAEYPVQRQDGLGYIPTSLWPLIFITVIILIVYILILLDYM